MHVVRKQKFTSNGLFRIHSKMQGKQNYEGQLVDNLKSEKDKRRKTVISFGNGF